MATQPNTIVRLNDYALAEFFPERLTISPSPVFYKLYNMDTGTHHIYNANGSPTMNSQDYSATYVAPNQYLYMNQEVSVPYWTRFPSKFLQTTPGAYDSFNKVRFHFTSGFDFAGVEALILSVKNKMNNGSYVFFCQLLVTPDWYVDIVKFNTAPIFLADMMFDRYVEVFVPAVQTINIDYYNQPPSSRFGEFGGQITYNGSSYSGLVSDAPVVLSIDECSRVDRVPISGDVYDMYITEGHYESVVTMDSVHQRFGTHIGESTEFDAIEFYGTSTDDTGNVSFVEDLINILSTNPHDSWVIAHQLTVYEWVNGSKVLSGTYMQLQESDFDSPVYYRPILKNSGQAIAFHVDYTCRLFNRMNGDQIIRLGSYVSYNAAKYGKSLSKIPLVAPVQSHAVYNKIVKSSLEATDLFVEQNYNTTNVTLDSKISQTGTVVTSMIPMFFNVNSISVAAIDAAAENLDIGKTIIYKQGDLRFILSPFDNMLKFKVYSLNNKSMLVPMDLSGMGVFNLVFMNNNKKVKFAYLIDSGTSNPSNGELMFKVPQKDSELIITSNTREFYITLVAKDGTETMLYSGFWNDITEKSEVDANIEKVSAQQVEILTGSNGSSNSVFSSVASGVITTPKQTPMISSDAESKLEINVPGYVPASAAKNDVSIVHNIVPLSMKSSGDSNEAKAASALGKVLGNQANNTKKTA